MNYRSASHYNDQATEAAFLHTTPCFYFIGPFSRRVSFASQQRRAIDLVCALHEKGRLKELHGKRRSVAVIGGGIAGLTAAALLYAHGCRVHVYESAATVLNIQRAAHHRFVHPTIARWPGRPLEYSTNFGFLDWCAGTGDQVITAMLEDWNQRIGPRYPNQDDFGVFKESAVEQLIGGQRASLKTSAKRGTTGYEASNRAYDLAIVAVGFGPEVAPHGLNAGSYWAPDEVDAWRETTDPAYVSGCGDGGLIDCLRLVHGHFQEGWLTVRLAQLLSREWPAELLDKIEAIEHDALLIAKSIRCMDIANAKRTRKKRSGRYDQVSEKLHILYEELGRSLPDTAERLLSDSIDSAHVGPEKVYLYSPEATPYTPNSAPIHKIMLAHAIKENYVRYSRGSLSFKEETGTAIITVKRDDGRPEEVTPNKQLVVRHGAESPLLNLKKFSQEEVESLRLRQFMLADYLDMDSRPNLPDGLHELPVAGNKKGYYATKLPSVQSLMEVIRPGCGAGFDEDGFTYATLDIEPTPDPEDIPPLDVPASLFGVPVTKCDAPEITAL